MDEYSVCPGQHCCSFPATKIPLSAHTLNVAITVEFEFLSHAPHDKIICCKLTSDPLCQNVRHLAARGQNAHAHVIHN